MARQNPWAVFFDHVAIATNEPEQLKAILAAIGLLDHGSESVASQAVLTHFLRPANCSEPQVEVLEPTDPNSVIKKFLDKRGPGIHHLCFRVDRLDELTEKLKGMGVRLVYAEARPGAHETRVNFIHPDSAGGILIEISEKIL